MVSRYFLKLLRIFVYMLDDLKERHKYFWWLKAVLVFPFGSFLSFVMTSVIFSKIEWLAVSFMILAIFCYVVIFLCVVLIIFFRKKIREEIVIDYSLKDNFHIFIPTFIIPFVILLISTIVSFFLNL